jgi:hypothetical protein
MSLGYEVRTWIPSGVTTTVCPGGGSGVGPGLDREDHARLDDGVVADVEERRLVVAQPDRVANALPPVGQQVVGLEVRQHGNDRPSAQVVPVISGSLLKGTGSAWSLPPADLTAGRV